MKIKNLFLALLILSFGTIFFIIDSYNYQNHKLNQRHIINHPEMLPQKEYAHYMSFGFSNLRANLYWLETIQYIGSNVISHEYKKYLYNMLDLITELNPYFERPYLVGQLLLPGKNDRYESLTQDEVNFYNTQAVNIGEKGIKNFCNKDKIQKIISQDNLEVLWSDEKYKDPCLTHRIPFNQAFLKYYYLDDIKNSANYYKITSVNSDALAGAKNMSAIMSGRSGNRIKSTYMFLTMASSEYKDNEICNLIGKEIATNLQYVFETENIDYKIIERLNTISDEFIEINEKDILGGNCDFNLNRAIREINLYYLEQANKKFYEVNGEYLSSGKELLDNGYINYLPKDFQQYENSGIIYYFNENNNNFDYKMGYE